MFFCWKWHREGKMRMNKEAKMRMYGGRNDTQQNVQLSWVVFCFGVDQLRRGMETYVSRLITTRPGLSLIHI